MPVITTYGAPDCHPNNEIIIQGNRINQFEIYRQPQTVFVIVDLSAVPVMNSAIFRSIFFNFKKPTRFQGFSIIGQKEVDFSLFPFKISFLEKNSPRYNNLLSSENSMLFLPSRKY